MLLFLILFEIGTTSPQADRLIELGKYSAVSRLCADQGYAVADDFGNRLAQRALIEADALGFSQAELELFLAPYLMAFIDSNRSELETAITDLERDGNTATLSSLLLRRDKICLQMSKDPITADLIMAGTPEARDAARATRVEAITRTIAPDPTSSLD